MSRLEELIAALCPDGVRFEEIGKLCNIIAAPKKLNKKEYNDIGSYPIIDQGQSFIVGYTNDATAVIKKNQYVIFGDHTREIKFVDFEFCQGADGIKILLANDNIKPRFLYHAMLGLQITNRGYNRHWSLVSTMLIPVPPLPVQEEIVRILDTFSELTEELTEELTKRKLQYQICQNYLFENSVYKEEKLDNLCIIQSGGTPSKKNKEYWDNGTIKWLGSTVCKNQKKITEITGYITELGYKKSSAKMLFPGTTLVAMVGATIGKVAYLDFCATTNQNVASLYSKDTTKLNNSYLFYAIKMLSPQFIKITNEKFGMVSLSFIRGLSISVPPLEEQERIVSILDRFDALCNDLTSGLPAEIEARKRQYEYYRDKLLTFKESV